MCHPPLVTGFFLLKLDFVAGKTNCCRRYDQCRFTLQSTRTDSLSLCVMKLYVYSYGKEEWTKFFEERSSIGVAPIFPQGDIWHECRYQF